MEQFDVEDLAIAASGVMQVSDRDFSGTLVDQHGATWDQGLVVTSNQYGWAKYSTPTTLNLRRSRR